MKSQKVDIKRYSISKRKSKVSINDLASAIKPGSSIRDFIEALPRQLAGVELRDAAKAIVKARSKGRPVIVGFGGHVIKVGLGPILVDLIERNIITSLATNGAGMIHDFELAIAGKTSEDVDATLGEGAFGFAAETAKILNACADEAASAGMGLGASVGRWLTNNKAKHIDASVLASAYKHKRNLTVHVAIGTDIVHIQPEANGSSWGAASLTDFNIFSEAVAELDGGVYLNLGSAVILPEVFLKAVTLARNRKKKIDLITTIDIDFIRQYRSLTNVVRRPTANGGRGISLTGHHELLAPLLFAAVIEETSGGFL